MFAARAPRLLVVRLVLGAALAAGAGGAAACVDPAGLDQRPCPCTTGFACCAASETCVSPAMADAASCTGAGDAGDDRSRPPADAAADPSRQDGPPDIPPIPPPADQNASEPPPTVLPEPPPVDGAQAECTPAATRCAGPSMLQSCDAVGRWVDATSCPFGCLAGACAVCVAPARRCAGNAPQSCSAAGQWVSEPACPADSACSAGQCLCSARCDEGAVHRPTSGLLALAIGGDALFYHDGQTLRRWSLSTGQLGEPFPLGAGQTPEGDLAADQAGNLYWCRRQAADDAWALMRNGVVLEPAPCARLRLTATHIYFAGGVDIFRRPLDPGPAARVAHGIVTAFDVDVDDGAVYHGTRARAFTQVIKTPAGSPADMTVLFEQVLDPITSLITDGRTVYFAAGRAVYRLPASGGTLDPFSEASDRTKLHVAHTDTHVYWTSVVTAADTGACLTSTVFRRAKVQPGDGAAEELTAAYGGACPVALVPHGRHVYLGLEAPRDPSGDDARIIRIRQ